jgi:hypothetical protein
VQPLQVFLLSCCSSTCAVLQDTSPARHPELPAAETDWTSLFAKAKNHIDAGAIVTKALIHKPSTTRDAMRNIVAQKPMFSYGIVSMIAVELRNCFGREFKAIVSTTEIMLGATFLRIGILVAQRSMMESSRCIRFLGISSLRSGFIAPSRLGMSS